MALNKHTNILSLLIEPIVYILYNFSIMTVPAHGHIYGDSLVKLIDGTEFKCFGAFSNLNSLCYINLGFRAEFTDFSLIESITPIEI